MSAPLVKFKTSYFYVSKIERIECVRESDRSVWIANEGSGSDLRLVKVSDYRHYHDTWELAHAHLMANAAGEVIRARNALESANGRLGNIKGMKPPAA